MNQNLVSRLWDKDTGLWTSNEEVAKKITHRLGWLDATSDFSSKLHEIKNFEKKCTFDHVVLLGMGGSSLISEVFLNTIGPDQCKRKFYILDSTDAAHIQNVTTQIDQKNTLFIVASKSGNTLEVQSLFAYFWDLVQNPLQFIAITDPGTKLEALSLQENFAKTFINPADIGGRFSALSYFGLLPFALMGGDLEKFWARLQETLPVLKEEQSPALSLASQLFQAHQEGLHKLTLQATQALESLPAWIEQLIAESTGKENKGFLPVIQCHGVTPYTDSYVHAFGFEEELDEDMNVHSVSVFHDIYDLAPEILLWEMTTALLGALLEINPFSEPHVNSTKEKTATYLTSADPENDVRSAIKDIANQDQTLTSFLNENPEKITCILSYLPKTKSSDEAIENIKKQIQAQNMEASINIGPRYLHSTGQFHKGGKDIAKYVILTQDQEAPMVPGQNYNFNTLKQAQALGDFQALQGAQRQVILLHT